MTIRILDTDIIFHDKKEKNRLLMIRKTYIKLYDTYVIYLMSLYKHTCYGYRQEFEIMKNNENAYCLNFPSLGRIYTFDYLEILLKSQQMNIPDNVMNEFINICNKYHNR